MTSLGKNICANKAGERVEGPGQELPVSAMAKMFDKSILSPEASGVASRVADEDPGWVMGARASAGLPRLLRTGLRNLHCAFEGE